MATKFVKKGATPDYTISPNATYRDLYDNNISTTDIQNGTVDDVTDFRMFLADWKLPAAPPYGSANLVGARLSFYINSATSGVDNLPSLEAYKLKTEIGNNVGGKATAVGSLVANKDIVQLSAFHSDKLTESYIVEDWTGELIQGYASYTRMDRSFDARGFSYLSRSNGYKYGNEFGKSSLKGDLGIQISSKTHFNWFGTVHPDFGEIYIIEPSISGTNGVFYKSNISVEDNIGRTRHEKWSNWGGGLGLMGAGSGLIKYAQPVGGSGLVAVANARVERSYLNIKNTILDSYHETDTFVDNTSDTDNYTEIAFGKITRADDFKLNGAGSLQFESVYPHRFNTSQQIYYPPAIYSGAVADGSDNQQVSWASSIIPKPAHLYTIKPTPAGDGLQPVIPTIELDMNIRRLAPMLIRNQNSGYAEPAHDYRLTRSITITFGEEPPNKSDSLFTYVKQHAPNAATAGTGSGTGAGTSAKSFFGISFVRYNGFIAYYNLGNAGKSSSTYTDSTFGIDNSRGEVCFANAPTYLLQEGMEDWFTLAFQLHPNHQGAYWAAYEPSTGKIVAENAPYGTYLTSSKGSLLNLKNITASGTGIWANNIDDFPKYMTVWCSNYQAVKGKYNADAGMYETGLRVTAANTGGGSGSTNLVVHSVNDATASKTVAQNAAGKLQASALLLDRGDDITIATNEGASDVDAIITENPNTANAVRGGANLTLAAATQWSDGDYVFHKETSQLQDEQITEDNYDCHTLFNIDEIRLKHFNMIHSNATPNKDGQNTGSLFIPKTEKTPNTGWQNGSSTVSNINNSKTQQPSYLCFGFDDLTDLTGPQGLGSFTDATCDTTHTGGSTTTVTHDANPRIVAGLQVSGTGIASGAFIVSITDSTHFVMSEAATATNSNQTLTFDAVKFLLMNGFKAETPTTQSNIVTDDDSDISNIRVGYSSSMEDYGRQNTSDSHISTAGTYPPDTGYSESAVFSNAETSPDVDFRGLIVGDLDSAATFTVGSGVYNNDPTITHASSSAIKAGMYVSGDGIPTGAYVDSVTDATHFELSVSTTGGSLTGKTLTFSVNNEFSVVADGSGNDGVGNVDYFTQKGLMKFKFGYRKSSKITVLDNAADAVLLAGGTEFKVTDGSDFAVNDYIMMGDEIMLVDQIADDDADGAFTKATFTVRRAQHGTTAVEHADATNIYRIAMPEKRECIFASSRIIDVINETTLLVDSPSIFNCKREEEYICYKYDDPHSAPTGFTGDTLQVISKTGNEITFNGGHGFTVANMGDYFISPKRYWLIVEVLNIGGAHGWQDDTKGTTKYLPTKQYDNVVQLFEVGTYGATFNESKYNDGRYLNAWNIDNFTPDDVSILSLKDYSFGDYDEETQTGGHCGKRIMNINEIPNTYQEINLGSLIEVDGHKNSDTIPLLLKASSNSDFKLNIDTELGTNKPYMLAEYEDSLPTITNYEISPNEDNPYNIDFTWECGDTDLWYGFIMVSPDEVNNQYSGAVLHYPMNEDGTDGAKAVAPIDQIQGMTTAVDSTSSTGPFYDIEGLTGMCLRNDTTNTPAIEIGTGSADPLASTGYAITDEMSINMHIIPDADTDGTLSQTNCLIGSTQRIFVKLLTDRTVFVQLYWDTDSATTLYSTSKLVCDGETPTNIMITFDGNLTSGNIKLFVNGKLEDQTGECIIADASGVSQTSWLFKSNVNGNNNKIFLGNSSDTGGQEFSGRMEEVVFYNRCLYPINPNDGRYIFTKPIVELSETSAKTGSKAYSAKLFIKDYHNIRGTTTDEVASSSAVSFKKAAFRLDNS